ncbi:collagen alpha-1(I) chain-like [Panthera pardus]|uniref:Collagen alpha-1(I) chain-like n=1 Tax=Panthera pardus TaxID=9691 RepID=A0A9W2W3M8_PANPR|nr:collagen alpha-1(I) chain-like [Panthera pardus]
MGTVVLGPDGSAQSDRRAREVEEGRGIRARPGPRGHWRDLLCDQRCPLSRPSGQPVRRAHLLGHTRFNRTTPLHRCGGAAAAVGLRVLPVPAARPPPQPAQCRQRQPGAGPSLASARTPNSRSHLWQPSSRLGLVSQAHRREGSTPPAGQQTAGLYGSREAGRQAGSALDRSAILTAGVGASPLAWLGRGANAGVLGRHGAWLAAVWVRKGRATRGGPGGAPPAASPPPPPPPPPARLPSLSHPHPQLPPRLPSGAFSPGAMPAWQTRERQRSLGVLSAVRVRVWARVRVDSESGPGAAGGAGALLLGRPSSGRRRVPGLPTVHRAQPFAWLEAGRWVATAQPGPRAVPAAATASSLATCRPAAQPRSRAAAVGVGRLRAAEDAEDAGPGAWRGSPAGLRGPESGQAARAPSRGGRRWAPGAGRRAQGGQVGVRACQATGRRSGVGGARLGLRVAGARGGRRPVVAGQSCGRPGRRGRAAPGGGGGGERAPRREGAGAHPGPAASGRPGPCSVGGIVVSIAAFQAVDPGSIPGQRSRPTFCAPPGPSWPGPPGAGSGGRRAGRWALGTWPEAAGVRVRGRPARSVLRVLPAGRVDCVGPAGGWTCRGRGLGAQAEPPHASTPGHRWLACRGPRRRDDDDDDDDDGGRGGVRTRPPATPPRAAQASPCHLGPSEPFGLAGPLEALGIASPLRPPRTRSPGSFASTARDASGRGDLCPPPGPPVCAEAPAPRVCSDPHRPRRWRS